MNFYIDESPIIACSTGSQSNTAIAVIRLSGFTDLFILQSFFSFNLTLVRPRFSHLTNLQFQDTIFDNILMVFFPKEASFTGENVLELSVHGNQLNIQNILNLFINHADFRLAHPGEFSYRALKNKKLTLSQVEGLDLLLNANSNLMLSQGLDILQGELHNQYTQLLDSFLQVKAAIEISIDFSDDIGDEISEKLFFEKFNDFFKRIDTLHSRTQGNFSSLLSPEIVLVGQTNAGKSSLFNLLVKHNRSIVSNIPGTTRDYISESLFIDGTNFNLVDTAGIRDSVDQIETIGINRSMEILARSFSKILVINPFETTDIYLKKFSKIHFDLILFSHADLPDFYNRLSVLDLSMLSADFLFSTSFVSGSIGPIDSSWFKLGPMGPSFSHQDGSIGPSDLLTSSGSIEPLVKTFLAEKYSRAISKGPILLERHRSCINKIYSLSLLINNNYNNLGDVAVLSSEINILSNYLSDLIGVLSPDDVLNSIFANFCIGK